MRLRVRTLPEGEDHSIVLEDGATGFRLLEVLNRNPEAHLLLRGTQPIPMDTLLDDSEEFAVVAIISGGYGRDTAVPRRMGCIAQPY